MKAPVQRETILGHPRYCSRRTPVIAPSFAAALLAATLTLCGPAVPAFAQASTSQAAPPAAGARVAGSVTAIDGNVVTIKNAAGIETKVTVPDSARVLQAPPGARSLSAATPVKLTDIAVGDRVLVMITPAADGTTPTATTLVAMKQADIAQKQQKDRQDWQTRGISGVVKAVDATASTITVSTGNGATAKTVAVQASSTTNIRRYAPDSTKFDDAKPATLDQIKPGDQLRAKGEKNADGSQVVADSIVAGTFRNIAGTVISVDAAAKTVTVTDLATKKPVVVSINADSQLHTLPPAMALGIAARLKGGPATPGGGEASGAGASTSNQSSSATAAPSADAGQSGRSGHGAGGAGGSAGQGGNLQQTLNRAPVLQLADLKKGDAVMVLTTEGQSAGSATAVTLLSGVEALLQASPSASQSVLSASWSLGGGAPGGDAAQ